MMHPGWLMPCFRVADLMFSQDWYARLGFRRTGGVTAEAWAVVANGPIELGLFCGHIPKWCLNWRGGDSPAWTARFRELGLNVVSSSTYDPAKAPREWNEAPDGTPYPVAEAGDCFLLDPEGRGVYFDTTPDERAAFRAGAPFSVLQYDGRYTPDQPRLGRLQVELRSADPVALATWYAQLGLNATPTAGGGMLLQADGQPYRLLATTAGNAVPVTCIAPETPDGLCGEAVMACSGCDLVVMAETLAARGIATQAGADNALWVCDPDGHRWVLRP